MSLLIDVNYSLNADRILLHVESLVLQFCVCSSIVDGAFGTKSRQICSNVCSPCDYVTESAECGRVPRLVHAHVNAKY